jgi:hypothetical protein
VGFEGAPASTRQPPSQNVRSATENTGSIESAGSTDGPVGAFIARFPHVSAATLDEAVETFRELLDGAIRSSGDGQVTLGPAAAAEVA